MAQAGNILALKLGVSEPGQVVPWNGNPIEDGWRTVMSVQSIWAKVQTTVLFGNSLYMIWYNIGQLDPQQGFKFFLSQYYNIPMNWAQFANLPPAARPAQVYRGMGPTPNAPPFSPPVEMGPITMLNAGFDPLRGYWIEFAGNYFLSFPIFKDWPTVIRDGPNYKGFQTSGAPGQGNPPGGTPGKNC